MAGARLIIILIVLATALYLMARTGIWMWQQNTGGG